MILVAGYYFLLHFVVAVSFFCERLLIGASSITARLGWFAAFFVFFFIVLRVVHPAFQLSNSPYIIFLAFVIMALGGVAMVIVVSKFGDEVRKMKQASAGTYEADVGRISATSPRLCWVFKSAKRPMRRG